MRSIASEMFCGQVVSQDLLGEIVVIVETFPKLTRTELANTICELFSWKRPTGKLKTVECRQFLECLDARGIIQLPACNHKYIRLTQPSVDHTRRTDCQPIISAKLSELTPLWLNRVRNYAQTAALVRVHQSLSLPGLPDPIRRPAALFHPIWRPSGESGLPAVFQSGVADGRQGSMDWLDATQQRCQEPCRKSYATAGFLIFPWVRVKNLASSVLSMAVKTVPNDWFACYGYRPVLIETLVDQKRYAGTCYRAANWVYVGETTGRGRMDIKNTRKGEAVKDIFLYPLSKNHRQRLMVADQRASPPPTTE
jgi:hypothetical protein